jgi:putative SOS response-associated peptidase YedK
MCGRAAKKFGARVASDVVVQPHFNIAPTQLVPALVNTDERELVMLRWGLVPAWASSPAEMKLSTFNARIETIATARAYREPLRSRRCAILADFFYEWQRRDDGSKIPLLIRRRDGEPFCFAGLWECWRRGGDELRSCTIITQPPNDLMRPIHSRMPVILRDAAVHEWLATGERDAAQMLALLEPQASSQWEAYAVSPRVGNVRNDDPQLAERV